jgi:carbamoyltransferase
MHTLGIHASFSANTHDPAVALVGDGKLLFSLEEERLSRTKTSVALFPERALSLALEQTGISMADISLIGVDGKKWESVGKIKIQRYLRAMFKKVPPIKFFNHELSHTAGAFYSSPFDDALCVTLDGNGDSLSGMIAVGTRKKSEPFRILKRFYMPKSLGVFYTVMTNYLGFRSIEDEYKVMGMAAYGRARYDLSSFVKYVGQGDFSTHPRLWFESPPTTTVWEPKCNYQLIQKLLGIPFRGRGKTFEQIHFDLAASIQKGFEQAYLAVIEFWLKKTGCCNLVLSGGCALNCMANEKLLGMPSLKNFYVFPGASDRGLSVGNAFLASQALGKMPRPISSHFLGPVYKTREIEGACRISGLKTASFKSTKMLYKSAAESLRKGQVIGWFQGRSELGPRALGARSILGLASVVGMKDRINAKIKFRESYRPFAPALLWTDAVRYGIVKKPVVAMRYMTTNVIIEKKFHKKFQEAMGLDFSSRIQLVRQGEPLHGLLLELSKQTECPVIINTSFNLAGEPNVEKPVDALRTFVSSGIDKLYFENLVVLKGGRG